MDKLKQLIEAIREHTGWSYFTCKALAENLIPLMPVIGPTAAEIAEAVIARQMQPDHQEWIYQQSLVFRKRLMEGMSAEEPPDRTDAEVLAEAKSELARIQQLVVAKNSRINELEGYLSRADTFIQERYTTCFPCPDCGHSMSRSSGCLHCKVEELEGKLADYDTVMAAEEAWLKRVKELEAALIEAHKEAREWEEDRYRWRSSANTNATEAQRLFNENATLRKEIEALKAQVPSEDCEVLWVMKACKSDGRGHYSVSVTYPDEKKDALRDMFSDSYWEGPYAIHIPKEQQPKTVGLDLVEKLCKLLVDTSCKDCSNTIYIKKMESK